MKANDDNGKILQFPGAQARSAESVADPIEAHHALVAVGPSAPAAEHVSLQRPAAFIAHLIAGKAQLPQTRERRRAEPDEAKQAYETALAARPYRGGRYYSRES